ncbi:hypothetical protein [Streptomyces sp. TS71-3]|uniref:hypothetical protein n=1 Tax=Streptomyces sp. TS71-3 TaxID=2733862 RepID=UPI001B125A00|nr:hypothetical protein [Streptomyces sp. TS71-3]GHJ39166.1 hypothetical protein Sm713_47750 [Streptomyces sp. TS71-3]
MPDRKDVDLGDDELLGLIGSLGAAASVAKDTDLDPEIRDMGKSAEWTAAERLSDAYKKANPE